MPKVPSNEVIAKRMEYAKRLLNAVAKQYPGDLPSQMGVLASIITTQIKIPALEQLVLFHEGGS